jgi:hypothetical protein
LGGGFLPVLEDKVRQLDSVYAIFKLVYPTANAGKGLRNRSDRRTNTAKVRRCIPCHVPYASLRANKLFFTITPAASNDSSVSTSLPGAMVSQCMAVLALIKRDRGHGSTQRMAPDPLFLSASKEQMLSIIFELPLRTA